MFRGKQDYFYLGETKMSFIEEKNLSSWKLQDFHRGRWEEEAHMKQNIHKMAVRLGGHRVLACMLSGFSRVWLWNPMDCGPPSSSVHGIHQARILERVAMPSSRGLPDSGIKPASLMSPTLAGGFFTTSATWEAYCVLRKGKKLWLGRTRTAKDVSRQVIGFFEHFSLKDVLSERQGEPLSAFRRKIKLRDAKIDLSVDRLESAMEL